MKKRVPLAIRQSGLVTGLFVFSFIIITVVSFATIRQLVKGQVGGQALEVSPPSQEITADPGQRVTIHAKIRNSSGETVPMTVHIEDFSATGDEGQVALSQGGAAYSVVGWTKVTPSSFTLSGGEEQEVTATLTVPPQAAGGRYGAFIFAIKPDITGDNGAAVSQQIASLFLLRISGDVDERLSLTGMSSPVFSEFGPVTMNMKFANQGNIHVKTYGLVNVTDMFGHKVADIVVPGTNIFPGAERIVPSSLNKTFLFGRYTAHALMYYGSHNDVLTAQTTFYVFPVRIIGGLVLILVIFFLLRKRFKKAFKAMTK